MQAGEWAAPPVTFKLPGGAGYGSITEAARFDHAGNATPWVKPGRAVWKYLDGGQNTLDEMKQFCKEAGELGFEYNVVEGFWIKWSDKEIKDLVSYEKERHVGIWLWTHSKNLRDPAARRDFLKRRNDPGVAGVKIDFFDHEAKEVIDLYQWPLREAAENELLVDFHGSDKPKGEFGRRPAS